MLHRKQAVIVGGIVLALSAALLVVFGDWPPFGVSEPAPDGVAERLALALKWMLVPAFFLFQGLGFTSMRRFTRPEAIDGQREGLGHLLETTLRYNTNTLEQGLLALVAWCGLALTLPAADLAVIPRMAVLFGVGRVLFFWGYLIAPQARVLGLGLTAYPTYGALIWLGWRAVQPS